MKICIFSPLTIIRLMLHAQAFFPFIRKCYETIDWAEKNVIYLIGTHRSLSKSKAIPHTVKLAHHTKRFVANKNYDYRPPKKKKWTFQFVRKHFFSHFSCGVTSKHIFVNGTIITCGCALWIITRRISYKKESEL
jgi:hypothetical protein